MSAAGQVLGLVAREERGGMLSPEEQRLVDDYWNANAVPMTVEQRQRFIAAAKRGLDARRRRIDEWRYVLFWMMWAWFEKQPTWHDFFDCAKCHPWPPVNWVGPYELGCEVGA